MWQWNIHSPGRSSNVTSSRTVVFIGTLTVSFHASGRTGSPFSSTDLEEEAVQVERVIPLGVVLHDPELRLAELRRRNGFAFQNGTPLTWNSDLLSFIGGSVSTKSTGVAPSIDGARQRARDRRAAARHRRRPCVNSIVSTSSTLRYSTLP